MLKFSDKSSCLKWENLQQYFYLCLSTIKTGFVYIGMSGILRREREHYILVWISSSGANMCAKEKSSMEIQQHNKNIFNGKTNVVHSFIHTDITFQGLYMKSQVLVTVLFSSCNLKSYSNLCDQMCRRTLRLLMTPVTPPSAVLLLLHTLYCICVFCMASPSGRQCLRN